MSCLADRHPKRRNRKPEYALARPVMNFFSKLSSASSQYLGAPLAPIHKRTQQVKPRDALDDFLSSDLDFSLASSSPPCDYVKFAQDIIQDDSMDISPAPPRILKAPVRSSKPTGRPRAYTSGARMFGQDMTNSRAPTSDKDNLFLSAPPAETPSLPSDDAMDVDPAPLEEAHLLSPPPSSSVSTVTAFDMFNNMTPSVPLELPSVGNGQPKKRRSLSPEGVSRVEHDIPSSPPPSSPSQHKLERMGGGPLLSQFGKPGLQGLGVPSNANKRGRRPILSAMVHPVEGTRSAYPVMESEESPCQVKLNLSRRVVSAMLPPSDADDSFDGPDMSSPAQAYIKRHQAKTVRRRDGTEDFKPLTTASPLVNKEVSESPSAKFMLAGFGDNEALGKILPCHRVREDGLMRIAPKTLDALLDGAYASQVAHFQVIDCRFDYEYNGGHIPGAININTTAGVEEFLSAQTRPKPCVSGDSSRKTVLVFHCEFSAKRAPTIAKHLRSKDRAMNNHLYPKIHYPEVYILEGGYCGYYKQSWHRCKPQGYVTMDDPSYALSRREDMDQFRKAKFGRTKSCAYGDLGFKVSQQQQPLSKRNTAPSASHLFAAANIARTRHNALSTLNELGNLALTDDEETDIGDSPCPPPTKGASSRFRKLGKVPVGRAETYDAARMAAY